jgi:hypothetical protein
MVDDGDQVPQVGLPPSDVTNIGVGAIYRAQLPVPKNTHGSHIAAPTLGRQDVDVFVTA